MNSTKRFCLTSGSTGASFRGLSSRSLPAAVGDFLPSLDFFDFFEATELDRDVLDDAVRAFDRFLLGLRLRDLDLLFLAAAFVFDVVDFFDLFDLFDLLRDLFDLLRDLLDLFDLFDFTDLDLPTGDLERRAEEDRAVEDFFLSPPAGDGDRDLRSFLSLLL